MEISWHFLGLGFFFLYITYNSALQLSFYTPVCSSLALLLSAPLLRQPPPSLLISVHASLLVDTLSSHIRLVDLLWVLTGMSSSFRTRVLAMGGFVRLHSCWFGNSSIYTKGLLSACQYHFRVVGVGWVGIYGNVMDWDPNKL